MAQSFTGKKRIRKSFGRIPEAVQMPNLIEVQRSSYEQFLQREVRAADRREEGVEAVFKSVFPIKDFNERAVLEYVSYEFEEPKYDVEECVQRDMTYAAPLKVKLRLIVFETDEETGARSDLPLKELFVGGPLNLDEVRHLHSFGDAAERLPDPLLAGEGLRHFYPLQGARI